MRDEPRWWLLASDPNTSLSAGEAVAGCTLTSREQGSREPQADFQVVPRALLCPWCCDATA